MKNGKKIANNNRMTLLINLFPLCSVLFSIHGNAQNLEGFNKDIDELREILELPSIIVSVEKDNNIIFNYSYGYADAKNNIKLTENHILPIASITKSFTSIALKQLENQDKLSLNNLIDDYENVNFNPNRWNASTTISHVISHTSESDPIGSQFIYNGGKYNLVYNVFKSLNKQISETSGSDPFAIEIDKQILKPLQLDHTLVEFSQEKDGLRSWIADTYSFNEETGFYERVQPYYEHLSTGPGFGMLSSIKDLMTFSRGIKEKLISDVDFEELTTPFYQNSPHGRGWFSSNFEGINLIWGYGYDDNDSAILLKVPETDYTLAVLSPCPTLSGSTRLGYGRPMNSVIITSFVKNILLNVTDHINYSASDSDLKQQVQELKKKHQSRVFLEEAFAMALMQGTMPEKLKAGSNKTMNPNLFKILMEIFPDDQIWHTPSAFELLSFNNGQVDLNFAQNKVRDYLKLNVLHPVKHYYSAKILQKAGQLNAATEILEELCYGDAYKEQPYKLSAMFELANHYKNLDKQKAISLLERLIHYKTYISVNDSQYREAKTILNQLKNE